LVYTYAFTNGNKHLYTTPFLFYRSSILYKNNHDKAGLYVNRVLGYDYRIKIYLEKFSQELMPSDYDGVFCSVKF